MHQGDSRLQVPLHRSEHHRHQQGKTAPDAREASSICIKWTLAWQVPPRRREHHVHQADFRLAGAKKRASSASSGLLLGSSPPPPHALPGAPPKKQASTASAGPSIACIGWTLAWQLPRPKKPASSAPGGLLLVKLPERHLHQVDSRLAVAPPEEASITGIRRAAPCQTARASSASGGLSLGSCPARRSEHRRHQEGCSLSNCPSITCIRWTLAWQLPHHRHQEGCSLSNCPSITCNRWNLAWQLPRPKKRASSASGGLLLVKLPEHHLLQVDSRLPGPPPPQASEHHRHQLGCFL